MALTIYLGGDILIIFDSEPSPTEVPAGEFSTVNAPDLGSAANYAVLAGSTVINAILSVINVSVPLTPL